MSDSMKERIVGPKSDEKDLVLNTHAASEVGLDGAFVLAALVERDHIFLDIPIYHKDVIFGNISADVRYLIYHDFFLIDITEISNELNTTKSKVKKCIDNLIQKDFIFIEETVQPKRMLCKLNRSRINNLYMGLMKDE